MSEFQKKQLESRGLDPLEVRSIDGNGRDWKWVKSGPGESDYAWRYADHYVVTMQDGSKHNFVF